MFTESEDFASEETRFGEEFSCFGCELHVFGGIRAALTSLVMKIFGNELVGIVLEF